MTTLRTPFRRGGGGLPGPPADLLKGQPVSAAVNKRDVVLALLDPGARQEAADTFTI